MTRNEVARFDSLSVKKQARALAFKLPLLSLALFPREINARTVCQSEKGDEEKKESKAGE